MLSRWRKRIQGLDLDFGQLVSIAVGLIFVCLIGFALLRSASDVQPEVVRLTVEAAATQTNALVPTLASNLTLTPQEAILTNAAPTLALAGRQEIRQFAASAEATSQLGEADWAAVQAVGPNNTAECGDFKTAWAPSQPQSSLTLFYAQLVRPTNVIIHQTYNPGYIIRVTITDIFGEEHTIYEALPVPTLICPYALALTVGYLDDPGNVVNIYIDQSASTTGPAQIDAVELIGVRY